MVKKKGKPKKKKTKKVIKKVDPSFQRDLILKMVHEHGVTVYNAAMMSGMNEKQALDFTSRELQDDMLSSKPNDIAERMMLTPRVFIQHMAQRSGLLDEAMAIEGQTTKGATKVVSLLVGKDSDANAKDFVEVPDFKTQLGYLKELTAYLRNVGENDREEKGDTTFNITFNVLPETATPDEADAIIEAEATVING